MISSTAIAATALVWVALELVQSLRGRANASSDDRHSLVVVRACIWAAILLAALATRLVVTAIPRSSGLFAVSLLLLWAGIGLRWWCFRTLGRYFTFTVMTSADQQVVTSGPYRLLRHPSYAGMLLALVGVGFAFGNWLSLAAAIVLPLLGIMYRIHVEESALAAALGSTYTSYAASRKRIVPLVW